MINSQKVKNDLFPSPRFRVKRGAGVTTFYETILFDINSELLKSKESKNIRAYAKLNIRLKITGRRPDGYHNLVSIMVPVSLYDLLELTIIPSGKISLFCQGHSTGKDEENLAYLAADSFFSRTGITKGLAIRMKKNIPVGAGLGGGSSDAASVLNTLNEMFSNPLSFKELSELGAGLGADVPFFLYNRPCIARGIGEILEPIENWPKIWYVIVTPPLHVSTSWVYANLKLKLTKGEYKFILNFLGKEFFDASNILENDLESVTCSYFPFIHEIKNSLSNAGAEGVLMSGSGPSVFGIFNSEGVASQAKEIIIPQNLGDVFAVEQIDGIRN